MSPRPPNRRVADSSSPRYHVSPKSVNCETLVERAGDPGDVVGPAAGSQCRHDRVVLDHAQLVKPVRVDEVGRDDGGRAEQRE